VHATLKTAGDVITQHAGSGRLDAMDGIGPITNTRTIDDAIGEAIAQLRRAPQTSEVARLLVEVRRYQETVSSWTHEPPPPDVQFEIIGELMSVLGKAMTVAKNPRKLERQDVDAPRVRLGPGGPISEPITTEASEPDSLPSLELDMPARGHATLPGPMRAIDDVLGLGDRLEPVGGEEGICPQGALRLIEVHRLPWRPSALGEGVLVRSITSPGQPRRHLVVRLAPGAALPEHQHATAEVLMVWDGSVEVGPDLLSAGGIVIAAPGDVGSVIRSAGEATLVLFDTDRHLDEP
jgi:quercetin dioxygenase-like cupin family protein